MHGAFSAKSVGLAYETKAADPPTTSERVEFSRPQRYGAGYRPVRATVAHAEQEPVRSLSLASTKRQFARDHDE
jgi:hypothetical protein